MFVPIDLVQLILSSFSEQLNVPVPSMMTAVQGVGTHSEGAAIRDLPPSWAWALVGRPRLGAGSGTPSS